MKLDIFDAQNWLYQQNTDESSSYLYSLLNLHIYTQLHTYLKVTSFLPPDISDAPPFVFAL